MKGFGLYLIILVLLLAGVSYVVSQTQRTESITYSDVYTYFTEGKVDQYDVEGKLDDILDQVEKAQREKVEAEA